MLVGAGHELAQARFRAVALTAELTELGATAVADEQQPQLPEIVLVSERAAVRCRVITFRRHPLDHRGARTILCARGRRGEWAQNDPATLAILREHKLLLVGRNG